MGCDIHAHFEIKVDDKWHHYDQPRLRRWYELFGKMAGVRSNIKQIAPVRGLPDDLSFTTKLDAERSSDWHTHSYLNSREVAELLEWIERTVGEDSWKFEFGYLFDNEYGSFHKYKNDYPDFLQDFRLVFWFDN